MCSNSIAFIPLVFSRLIPHLFGLTDTHISLAGYSAITAVGYGGCMYTNRAEAKSCISFNLSFCNGYAEFTTIINTVTTTATTKKKCNNEIFSKSTPWSTHLIQAKEMITHFMASLQHACIIAVMSTTHP